MSNYLNQIAAKSLNLLPVVRPRIATVFEPSADGLPFKTGISEVESEIIPEKITIASSASPGKRSQRDDSPGITTSHHPVFDPPVDELPFKTGISEVESEITPEEITTTSPVISEEQNQKTDSPEITTPHHQNLSQTRPSITAPSFLPLENIEPPFLQSSDTFNELKETELYPSKSPTIFPVHVNADSGKRSQMEKLNTLQSSQSSSAKKPAAEPVSSKSLQPLIVEDHPHSTANIEPVSVSPSSKILPQTLANLPVTTSSRSRANSESNSSHISVNPTIQVTIGRIEVRAIAPKQNPGKTPKSRPAKPSLEKYLHGKSNSRVYRHGGIG